MKTIAVALTAENYCIYYQLCHTLKLNTLEQRLALLSAMEKEGKVIYGGSSDLTQDEFIQDLAKHFGKVLRVKGGSK